MLKYFTHIFVFYIIVSKTYALWDNDTRCPLICTCRLEHLSETAIYRFMQGEKKETYSEVESAEAINNDVFYEENLEKVLLEDKPIVRSTTCILQTETDPEELIRKLPKDIETLTFIQGYKSGNKTVKFSDLTDFSHLISLELIGANLLNKKTDSHLICEIDKPFAELQYVNLERILIKNSKKQIQNFVREIDDEDLTFEYVQRLEPDAHPLTMVQEGPNEEIVPYEIFKEQAKTNEVPLFIGFENLLLLRISHCELNSVHWEMFDGLTHLQYLILEKNNLHFIPAFAFYGTPGLKHLSLAHNNLLDIQITDLAGLLELEFLDLSYNNFSQLSELSLPPFPKLQLANFANNPISVIFANTFEVMNTTQEMIIGSDDMPLKLIANSFLGLNLLKKITLNNLSIKVLKQDLLVGMPNLKELILTGNITQIEFDAFLEVYRLEKLVMSNCQIQNISMDSFIGMEKLLYLDLSKNKLEYLPPGVFDQLINIKELYLNGNKLTYLPKSIFAFIHPRLLRLNDNPWHCSCHMGDWKPMLINKVKQKVTQTCDFSEDKGVGCITQNKFMFKYVYNNRVAPKCTTPKKFSNSSVFHVMRRQLKCPNYRPKLRKNNPNLRIHHINSTINQKVSNTSRKNDSSLNVISSNYAGNLDPKTKGKLDLLNYKLLKHESLAMKNNMIHNADKNYDRNLNMINDNNLSNTYAKSVIDDNHLSNPFEKSVIEDNHLSNAKPVVDNNNPTNLNVRYAIGENHLSNIYAKPLIDTNHLLNPYAKPVIDDNHLSNSYGKAVINVDHLSNPYVKPDIIDDIHLPNSYAKAVIGDNHPSNLYAKPVIEDNHPSNLYAKPVVLSKQQSDNSINALNPLGGTVVTQNGNKLNHQMPRKRMRKVRRHRKHHLRNNINNNNSTMQNILHT